MDYSRYLTLLARRWRLIAAGTTIAALVALVVILLLPRTYEATATILVTRPSFQFDARLPNVASPGNPLTIPSKAYMALAKTDAVERTVIQELGPALGSGEREPGALLAQVKVEQAGGSRGDPNVFEIKAQATDPDKAQRITNAWAAAYLKLAQELYGQSEQKLVFLDKELAAAAGGLKLTEHALVQFQGKNSISMLQGQLAALVKLYNDQLALRNNLRLVRQDAVTLYSQLLSDPTGGAGNAGLPALLLQIRSLNSTGATQLQIPVPDLRVAAGRDAQLRQAEGLIQAMDEQEAILTQKIEVLEGANQVQTLQASLQSEQNELDRLIRERDLKKLTYTTLANKAEEARIESSAQAKEVQLASSAARPERPISRNTLPIAGLAAMLGLLISAAAAIVMEYLVPVARAPQQVEDTLPVAALSP